VKALSLTQPWATAIELGWKRWETRSWRTFYRGEIAIHAAKGFPGDAKDFARGYDLDPAHLPLGKIILVCNLTDCRTTESLIGELSEEEEEWGDYSPKRFAFKLENVRLLREPVYHRGALGLWHVAWDETNNILRQLKEKPACDQTA
jgi:activating signal cointegrator 1